MWNSQNVQLKHENSNPMSIVLQPNRNCIDRKWQLYSALEILSKYTAQLCNSTFGKKTKYLKRNAACYKESEYQRVYKLVTMSQGRCFLTETAVLTENDMGRWKVFKNIHDVHLWMGFYTISALKPINTCGYITSRHLASTQVCNMYICIHLPKVCHVKKIYMFIIARGIKPI